MEKLLSKKARGSFAEHLVASELIRLGYDIYRPCSDERGIDFILRVDTNEGAKYFDIQVKKSKQNVSIRGAKKIFNYLEQKQPKNYFLIIVVSFRDRSDFIYLKPEEIMRYKKSWTYRNKKTNELVVENDINIPANERDRLLKNQSLERLSEYVLR